MGIFYFAKKINNFIKILKYLYESISGIRRFESPYPLRRLYGPYFPLSSYPLLFPFPRVKLIAVYCLLVMTFGGFLSAGLRAYAQESSFLKVKVEKIAEPSTNSGDQIKLILRSLKVPKKLGFVKEVYVPKIPSSKKIINIQDLHCDYEAQKHIAGILDYLTTTYGLRVIAVEGGSGKIDTTFYKNLPDKKIKEQVADYFLREARINGTEFFAITTEKNIALYGAEDEKYYDKNLDAFLKALPERDRVLQDISLLENALNMLKDQIYNKQLRDLDDHAVSYENGELSFEDYVMYLVKLYPMDKFRREFKQLPKLYDSINLKNSLDLNKAENERNDVIDYLTKHLTHQALEDFLRATVRYKAKTLDSLAYHKKIRQLYNNMDEKTKTFDQAWPDLNKYIDYLDKQETLDKIMLFNELDRLVDDIKDEFYTSYTQKLLDHNLRLIRLARNLFSTKLLNRDLPYVKKYGSDFNARRVKRFIEREAGRLHIDVSLPTDKELDAMEQTLPDVEAFYRYATKRNGVLTENTLIAMRKEGASVGILVTGGFHTAGITNYLKEKEINYVVICPAVTKVVDDEQRYINALKGKKTPFEEMMENEKTSAPDVYFGKGKGRTLPAK